LAVVQDPTLRSCSSTPIPEFTVSNTGGQTLTWTAAISVSVISVTPSGGSVNPGSSQVVSISDPDRNIDQATITFGGNGGSISFQYYCLAP
jgi:hypothetical protein